ILGRIAKQMAEMPAKIFGIFPQKGALMPNSDADVVIFDPKPTLTLKADELHHIGGYSPYNNYAVYGKIETTICRGQILVHRGKFVGDIGRGRFVKGVLSK
ncbi:MAG: dihydropyrimidinase, partial [Phototrophicales bacterium]